MQKKTAAFYGAIILPAMCACVDRIMQACAWLPVLRCKRACVLDFKRLQLCLELLARKYLQVRMVQADNRVTIPEAQAAGKNHSQ